MLCQRCGNYVAPDDIICPSCGALIERGDTQEEGVKAIRQGKRAREEAANTRPAAPRPRGASRVRVDVAVQDNRALPPEDDAADMPPVVERPRSRASYGDTEDTPVAFGSGARHIRGVHTVTRHMVNWTHVAIAGFVVVIFLVVGAYLYLTNTAAGQKIMARLGRDATSVALWEVGEEEMDNGNIDQAITDFETARTQDGEDNINVDGLMLLGSAYEAAGRDEDAEKLYTEIYTTITPTRADAYRSMIRILLAQSREPEAADLMLLAYEKTGQVTFRQQRADLLPQAPTVDLTAGLYEEKKNITLSSAQGFDVYYTFDDNAELPSGGVKYTEPIFLDEGIHKLRAVAVNDDLISDPLSGTYKIIMPSPQTPRANLAPNTYKQRQRVRLKPGLENEKDEDIVIYYTIDGSNPDADSPVYKDDPIVLPGGKVTLRAVAVNRYGKASNTLEILYKIEAKPYPLTGYSTTDDPIGKLSLYQTTREDFQDKYGQGNSMEEVTLEGFDSPCEKYLYDWGYAVMAKQKSTWLLCDLYFTSAQFAGPRTTAIGDPEDYVVGQFRDMGQVESPSGNRGLYENDDGSGKIIKQDDGSRIIRYEAQTADSHTWRLSYLLNKSNVVYAIDWAYVP